MIMGDRYRVELVRIGDEADAVLFALEGMAELVAGTGSTLVSDAVRADAAEREGDDSTYVTGESGSGEADDSKPKRRRRTKAEIAADKQREIDEAKAELARREQVADAAPVESAAAASAEPVPTTTAAEQAAAASGAPAVPYDPFAAK